MDGSNPQDQSTATTQRLRLTAATLGDLEAMATLHADERVWRHFPTGRHRDVEQTRAFLVERERQWRHDGLGYWVARLREPVGELAAGTVVGIGGCAIPSNVTWWNLYYRLAPDAHGHGLGSELCAAAIRAARRTRPDLPVVAFLLEHNHASKATAERAGLDQVWRGPDTGNPNPGAVRLIYADRSLDEERLAALTRAT
jgi:RimJ/RimL family protein N-acetyltransferase